MSTIRQSGSVLDAADPSFGSPSGIHRAQSPTTDTGGLVLTRRDLFTLLGSAAVLVACGGKSHTTSPISVSSGTPESGATSISNSAPPPANGGSNSTSGSVV
ncbi:MAG TPA: hypothetical protein VIJ31_06910 [Acidothermaceae bacterium]